MISSAVAKRLIDILARLARPNAPVSWDAVMLAMKDAYRQGHSDGARGEIYSHGIIAIGRDDQDYLRHLLRNALDAARSTGWSASGEAAERLLSMVESAYPKR